MFKKVLLTILISLASLLCIAQKNWELKSSKDDLKIYTKTVSASGLKGIRVKSNISASLSQVVSLIMDVDAGVEWVYATKLSRLLRRVSANELYYYSEVEIPWPMADRDFISHLTATQNQTSKVVTIVGPTVLYNFPEKQNVVRVNHSYGKWILSPLPNNMVSIDYTLEVDPGGNIPVWLVNLFATSGPAQTFKKMIKQVALRKYANAKLSYIIN